MQVLAAVRPRGWKLVASCSSCDGRGSSGGWAAHGVSVRGNRVTALCCRGCSTSASDSAAAALRAEKRACAVQLWQKCALRVLLADVVEHADGAVPNIP